MASPLAPIEPKTEALRRDLKATLPRRALTLHTKDHRAFVRTVLTSNAAWDYNDLALLFNMAGSRLRRWHVLLPQTSFEHTKLVVDEFPHPLEAVRTNLHWAAAEAPSPLPLALAQWDQLDPRDQAQVQRLLAGLVTLQGAATPRLRLNHLSCANQLVTLGLVGFERLTQAELEFIHQHGHATLSLGADGTLYARWPFGGQHPV